MIILFLLACGRNQSEDESVSISVALTQTASALETNDASVPPETSTPVPTPTENPSPTSAPTTVSSTDTSSADTASTESLSTEATQPDLIRTAAIEFDIELDPEDPRGVNVIPLRIGGDVEQWAAFTTGIRDFEKEIDHQLAIYSWNRDKATWQLLDMTTLGKMDDPANPGPDYLSEFSVSQVPITPDRVWLEIVGGVGAHSGVYQIYSFDGTELAFQLTGFSSNPGAGAIRDLNGDGIGDVLLNATDYYVFCYACGVREVHDEVMRWDGTRFVPVELIKFREEVSEILREPNNRAVDLANAGLWKDAANEMAAAASLNEMPASITESNITDFLWNSAYIRHNASAKRDAIGTRDEGYPVMGYLFYGDYAAAIDELRRYEPQEIFSLESPLFVGTVAEGWTAEMGGRIETEVTPALALRPDLAAAHYLLGWAQWLKLAQGSEPSSTAPASTIDAITQARSLAPDEPFYQASLAFLRGEPSSETGGQSEASSDTRADSSPVERPLAGHIFYSAQDPIEERYYVQVFGVADGTKTKIVEDAIQPRQQPSGSRLAFYSTRNDMLGVGGFDVESGERLRFSFNTEDAYPAWNAAGNKLVFASNRHGDRNWRIYRTWADGNDQVDVLGFGRDPDWHLASNRVVFKGCDDVGNSCGIWLMNDDGSERQPLTNNPGDARPRWSPDGRFVVFMSDQRDGNWELYIADVASRIVSRLSNNAANDGLPVYSPDGSQIAWVSDRNSEWQILTVSSQGGSAQLLTPVEGNLPNWLEHGLDWVP
ncbi:hypothetical protein KFU94_27375 [Chloroflexi bacterium TSY]|nr:hypothetical protein [Chloroflexi bacterium TSY]